MERDRLWDIIYSYTKRQPPQDRDRWTDILIGALFHATKPNKRTRERIKRQTGAALKRARNSMSQMSERYDLDLMTWIKLGEKHEALKAGSQKFERSRNQVMAFILEELRAWFIEIHGCEPPATSVKEHMRTGKGGEWVKMLNAAQEMMQDLFKKSQKLPRGFFRIPKNANLVRYARGHIKDLRPKST